MEICRRSGSADLDDGAREAKNCTLPGFDPRRWQGTELVKIHMGLPARFDRDGQDMDFLEPLEPIKEDGCPGGWYRCHFISSLHKYRRGREGEGGRNENILLTRCQDRLVLEAIDYLEHEESHALGYFHECKEADG